MVKRASLDATVKCASCSANVGWTDHVHVHLESRGLCQYVCPCCWDAILGWAARSAEAALVADRLASQ